MRGGGEEADVGGVAAVDVRVRDAAEDAEVVAMRHQVPKVRRRRVVAPGAGREELVTQEAEVVADAEHPPRLRARCERR